MEATRTKNYISMLTCPKCADSDSLLEEANDSVTCSNCNREYKFTADGVLDLVIIEDLDPETRREMEGNFSPGTNQELQDQIEKQNTEIWQGYHWQRLKWEVKQLANFLNDDPSSTYFVLGEGTARSLLLLSKYVKFDTLYCADISMSAIRQVPWRLADKGISVGLFTSDLDECPISKTRSKDTPVIITYAIHHLPDMENCMEKMMQRDISRFYLLEPVTNRFLGFLARKKIAQRVEYSGVSPARFDLKKLEKLCDQYGYSIDIKTNWKVPNDYYHKLGGKNKIVGHTILAVVSVVSFITRPFNFGNGAAIRMIKM